MKRSNGAASKYERDSMNETAAPSTGADRKVRLAIIGWGAIGQTVGRLLTRAGQASDIDIVAVAVRDQARVRNDIPSTATVLTDPASLAATRPHVVAEAAGRDSVEPWGRAALGCGADLIVSSVSAFADAELFTRLTSLAAVNGAQIHIQPGALGGVDALSAARLMGIDSVEHRIVKPPLAWAGTPAEAMCDLEGIERATEFFSATATHTANSFPRNANVAMTTALAGIGPERTLITLVADPGTTTNRHEISAHGAFGRLDVTVTNNPLPDNPKTSAMAALSLVRAIENRNTTVVI